MRGCAGLRHANLGCRRARELPLHTREQEGLIALCRENLSLLATSDETAADDEEEDHVEGTGVGLDSRAQSPNVLGGRLPAQAHAAAAADGAVAQQFAKLTTVEAQGAQ